MNIKKFDVVTVNLNPQKGHVQAGIRPAIVIQSNLFNPYSSTVIIVPLTTQKKKVFPSEFLIDPTKKNGLKTSSRFLGSQIMTVDRKFVVKKMGDLEKKYYLDVTEALNISLDFNNDFVGV